MKKSTILSMIFLISIKLNATPLEKYTKLCEEGEATSCRSVGFMYKVGSGGVKQDYNKAVELYNKACDMGDSVGCSNLALMYEQGIGVKKNQKRADALNIKSKEVKKKKFYKIVQKHKDACSKDNALDCEKLAVLNELGKGVPKNLKNAMKLYTKACDLNSSYGCYHIGRMYDYGIGVKKDSKKALDIYTKGCDKKHGISCFALGDMYDKGEGVKKDSKKSVELYNKACDNNYPRACFNLGNAYAVGKGVKKDKKKALTLYEKACRGGDRYGCRNYQMLTYVSNPISKEGTWEDDPKNWQRAFGQGHSDRLKEIHSYYWRSAHWTLEYEYFFELALNEADSKDWIGNLKEKKGKECRSMMNDSFMKKPKWFLSDNKSNYRCFIAPKGRVKIFIHKKSGHFFMTDSII